MNESPDVYYLIPPELDDMAPDETFTPPNDALDPTADVYVPPTARLRAQIAQLTADRDRLLGQNGELRDALGSLVSDCRYAVETSNGLIGVAGMSPHSILPWPEAMPGGTVGEYLTSLDDARTLLKTLERLPR